MNEIFSRQLRFIGENNQKKLEKAKVTVVGCGSLGSVLISSLVRSGIDSIRIIDRDVVEKTNLYANTTFTISDLGNPKAVVMEEKMKKVNPGCKIESHVENLDYDNTNLLNDSDIVIDCTDNMPVRYLINDYCVKNKIPWIYGSVLGDEGYIMPVAKSGKPCFGCVFGDNKRSESTCDSYGVLSSIVFIIASLQVYETIKFFTSIDRSLNGQIVHVKLGEKESDIINVNADPKCKTCGTNEFPHLLRKDYTMISICGKDAYQLKSKKRYKINFEGLAQKLIENGINTENVMDMMIKIEHDGMKASLFGNGTAIIKSDYKPKAKKLYETILKILES